MARKSKKVVEESTVLEQEKTPKEDVISEPILGDGIENDLSAIKRFLNYDLDFYVPTQYIYDQLMMICNGMGLMTTDGRTPLSWDVFGRNEKTVIRNTKEGLTYTHIDGCYNEELTQKRIDLYYKNPK